MAEDDVDGEERRVRECEGEPERLGDEEDVGEDVDAGDRNDERESVAGVPRSERGERDHRQELDRGDRPERQPLDREVEAAVHDAERGAEGEDQPPLAGVELGQPRHGLRQSAKTAAAVAIRSQATPRGSTAANSRTANAGPR